MDYFAFSPASPEEISPLSVESEYVTAPSSRATSPTRFLGLPDPENGTAPENDRKVVEDVKKIEHELEQLLSIGDSIHKDLETLKSDTHIIHSLEPSSASAIPEQEGEQESKPEKEPVRTNSFARRIRRDTIFRASTPYRPLHQRSFSSPDSLDFSSSPPNSRMFYTEPETETEHNSHPFPPPSRDQEQDQNQGQDPVQGRDQDKHSNLTSLKTALSIIQSQISSLDEGIRANIEAQLKSTSTSTPSDSTTSSTSTSSSKSISTSDSTPNTTSNPPNPSSTSPNPQSSLSPTSSSTSSNPNGEKATIVLDNASLPTFKTPRDEALTHDVSSALLKTVKVCCVLERGLEAVIGVLEKGEEKDKSGGREGGGKEGDLMSTCLSTPKVVRKEMKGALKGIEAVVGYTGNDK